MVIKKLALFIILAAILSSCVSKTDSKIDLSGTWNFQIDSLDQGEAEKWFNTELDETIALPGSMAFNGKGNDITMQTEWIGSIQNEDWVHDPKFAPYHDPENIRFPFWLQPVKKYTGAAWYQREINIPGNWENKNLFLQLERCHWETTVWLDQEKLGSQNSLSTPHIYKINTAPGKHLLTIKVDNRIIVDVGINSHSISDHTQSNWNGIVGEIYLQAKEKIYIENLVLAPDIQTKSVKVLATIENATGKQKKIDLSTVAELMNHQNGQKTKQLKQSFQLKKGKNEIAFDYDLGEDALLWDEFHPNLYRLNVQIAHDDMVSSHSETFGLREIEVKNNQLFINSRKLFLRGTLECAIFPKTGFPSTDVEEWKRIFRVIKSHGLNHMRFHSWCPPEAAFIAADEEAVYLQVECDSWANSSTTLGDGEPVDEYVWEESKRIVKAYGNHPSFCLMAYGNEPGGANQVAYLQEFVNYWKGKDARRIYTSGAGWPLIPENDYHVTHREMRIQGWGQELNSIINAEPPKTNYDWSEKVQKEERPIISHEIGQWCVYPNFREIDKYDGVLKAKNFELFQESLNANHMGFLADSFLLASGKLQALCYKADIEAALRTVGQGGFQLLDLHDFPGQGTALVGVLDPFWEEKGYVTPKEFSQFCNAVVPLARMDRRIFNDGDTFKADIEIANFYNSQLTAVEPTWTIKAENGDMVGSGSLGTKDIPVGNGIQLGTIEHHFKGVKEARKLILEVTVANYANHWDLWIYPENDDVLDKLDILVTENMDERAVEALKNGENVLLSLGRGKVKEGKGGEVGVGFSSIFWNTAWTKGQKPHTLGILCNPDHPALQEFPTEYHSNWQWWDAMSHSDVVNLNDFPVELKPVVRVIDDWFSNRRLALLMEAKVGNGKLMVSGIDLQNDLEDRPEARQLLLSLNAYMNSNSFDPDVSIGIDQIRDIIN